ncbi:hypothetical protein GALMADRAFT_133577 [Galerina marginata CBS 339.88]|uniref:Uncharacterized protein n=1 Tax=Galerina marginata (strain CBS 339.88) TaxID=685588 RepID=A0A067TM16_GALM3|nr:hypothetical protein GALMADRAFT_133577 [Galerina marginata CBS 339.88]
MSQQTTFDRTLVFEPFASQAGIPDTTLIGGTVYGDSLDGNGYCARYILHSGGGYIMHFGVFTYSGSPAISGEGLSFFGFATLNFEDDGNGLGVDIQFTTIGRTIAKPIALFSTPDGRAYASILEFRPITNQPTFLLISGQRPGVVTCNVRALLRPFFLDFCHKLTNPIVS